MIEVKADGLEASFEALEAQEDRVEALKQELALLKKRVDEGVIAAQRPALDGVKAAEANAFVEQYLRKGVEAGLEQKALGSSTDPTGGYAVPREIDETIDRTLVSISPIRAIANVVKVGSAGYRKLITTGGTPSGWVAYEAARPITNTPTFSEIVPAAGDLYANPAASQQMLDDAMFDVEAWLASEIATEFARAEGMAFVKGTGTSQPLGFLSSPNAATSDGARPQGTLQFIGTGVSAGFPASNPQDKILDLIQSLRPPYRQGAVFVMNSATATAVRKFKTADGAYLWQPGMVSGAPATLLGYPVIEAEDMSLTIFDKELASIAFCWLLERRDGAGLALTSHDRALMVGDVRYEPAPGITPAAIQSKTGLEPSTSEIHGSLSSEAISEADIAAGRWDGAGLSLTATDWQEPGGEVLELLSGELGQVSSKDGAFEVDLLGAAAALERPVCSLTSPECRAELGDPACRVDMAGRRIRALVINAPGHIIDIDQPVDDRFRFGSIRFLAGEVNGERRMILAANGQQLSLRSALAGEVAVGTPVEIVEGCDKRFTTCSGRFGNAVNFRGEPHLPGNDLLTRYPGA